MFFSYSIIFLDGRAHHIEKSILFSQKFSPIRSIRFIKSKKKNETRKSNKFDRFFFRHTDVHSSFLQYELKNPLSEHSYHQDLFVVDNWKDFREKIFPLLLHLGAFCQDRYLFMKLTRLATHLMKKSSSEEYQEDILLLIDEVLFPSLTLLDVNGCVAIQLWSLLKLFPFDIRYGLYGQWYEETYRKTIPLINMKNEVNDKTRAILR